MVASTLLGAEPPRLPSRHLVRAGELFGISEGTTRVALSRMVNAGELESEDGWYRLAGSLLLARQARQAEGRHPDLLPWSGAWTFRVVEPARRSATVRSELRDAARSLHLAELREGVWLRPANLDPARFPSARAVVDAQCHNFDARPDPDGGRTARELAGSLWDLDAWAVRARQLDDELRTVGGRLEDGDPLELRRAWELSAGVLRHLLADPLLPVELLPADWPGAVLRDGYDRFDRRFKTRWRRVID